MAFKGRSTSGLAGKLYLWSADIWGAGIRSWVYVTTDAPGTIATSGYIDDQDFIDMLDVGDQIWTFRVGTISDSRSITDDFNTGGLTSTHLFTVSSISGATVALTADQINQATDTDQPAFSAYLSSDAEGVTGTAASGLYTVIFDTEIFDQASNYNNETGIFTAPIAGKYQFNTHVRLNGMTAAADLFSLRIRTSNRDYFWNYTEGNDMPGTYTCQLSIIADMDVGDLARVMVIVQEEASDVIDVLGDASVIETAFSGWLLG